MAVNVSRSVTWFYCPLYVCRLAWHEWTAEIRDLQHTNTQIKSHLVLAWDKWLPHCGCLNMFWIKVRAECFLSESCHFSLQFGCGLRSWEELSAVPHPERRGLFADLALFGAIKTLCLQDQRKLTPLANYCIAKHCSSHRCTTVIIVFNGGIWSQASSSRLKWWSTWRKSLRWRVRRWRAATTTWTKSWRAWTARSTSPSLRRNARRPSGSRAPNTGPRPAETKTVRNIWVLELLAHRRCSCVRDSVQLCAGS